MPANLSPEAAEASLRKTRDRRQRLEWPREMLRAVPQHKGTEHLQAGIKARIKGTEELEAGKKGGRYGSPVPVIRPEVAAQIALTGPPNAAKSALHGRLHYRHLRLMVPSQVDSFLWSEGKVDTA